MLFSGLSPLFSDRIPGNRTLTTSCPAIHTSESRQYCGSIKTSIIPSTKGTNWTHVSRRGLERPRHYVRNSEAITRRRNVLFCWKAPRCVWEQRYPHCLARSLPRSGHRTAATALAPRSSRACIPDTRLQPLEGRTCPNQSPHASSFEGKLL